MTNVPIAFAFDSNLVLPACICIFSLLENAGEDTFYDIFILHSKDRPVDHTDLNKIPVRHHNCRINYRLVDSVFDSAFEIRGITTPAYYRLLIPELIPEYDKIIYSDVDMIFRIDLSKLYQTDISDYYLAATRDLGLNFGKDGIEYISRLNPELHGNYLQSGFIMMNCKKIANDRLLDKFRALAKKKLKYQDQDILNLTCYGKVLYLPMKYNMTDYSYYYAIREKHVISHLFTDEEIEEAKNSGNIHFNGHKPWKKFSINFDIWWEYYRKSILFDEKFYFDFFYGKLNELDSLTLWKRIKLLARYFIYGRQH